MQGWIDLFRSLGESLLEVWRAELATLQDDFQRSGRHFGVALGLFGAAAMLAFWIVGLVLLRPRLGCSHVWLVWWGASLIVLGLFLLAGGDPGLARHGADAPGRGTPLETVRRRVDSHFDWWQHCSLLASPKTLDVDAATGTGEPLGRELP